MTSRQRHTQRPVRPSAALPPLNPHRHGVVLVPPLVPQVLAPMITGLPLWWRFTQSLRRAWETGDRCARVKEQYILDPAFTTYTPTILPPSMH